MFYIFPHFVTSLPDKRFCFYALWGIMGGICEMFEELNVSLIFALIWKSAFWFVLIPPNRFVFANPFFNSPWVSSSPDIFVSYLIWLTDFIWEVPSDIGKKSLPWLRSRVLWLVLDTSFDWWVFNLPIGDWYLTVFDPLPYSRIVSFENTLTYYICLWFVLMCFISPEWLIFTSRCFFLN